MNLESVLVTGANRGLGLEFVRQFAELPRPPKYIFATYRNVNTIQALRDLKDRNKTCRIILIQMDVSDASQVRQARTVIEETTDCLNLLVNNAGVLSIQPFHQIEEENLMWHFKINTAAPILVLKEMLPLLSRAASSHNTRTGMSVSRAAVINMSSTSGSMSEVFRHSPQEWSKGFGYRLSKAALNMAMRVTAHELADKGILVVSLCPGRVKTDMGRVTGRIEPEDSVSDILQTLARLTEEHHGTFIDRHGRNIPF